MDEGMGGWQDTENEIDRLLAETDEDDRFADAPPAPKKTASVFASSFGMAGQILAAACDATAALTRLEERLAGAPEHRRRGWMARWLCHTAMASARLDGRAIDVDEMFLEEAGAYGMVGEQGRVVGDDLADARRVKALTERVVVRSPRQLLTPNRLAALAALRPHRAGLRRTSRAVALETAREDRADQRVIALLGRSVDPAAARERLEAALDEDRKAVWAAWPTLVGAAHMLARWHECKASDTLGAAVGRVLSDQWARRMGLVTLPVTGIAVGFFGYRPSYTPEPTDAWVLTYLHAARRAAEAGLALYDEIERREQRVLEEFAGAREDHPVPGILRLLVERPAASIPQIASALGLSTESVRRRIVGYRREDGAAVKGLVGLGHLVEIAGRAAWRVYRLSK